MGVCKPWQKGRDCGWDQRVARISLLPILIGLLVVSGFLLQKLVNRNPSWLSRPVLCLLFCIISQSCDIIEHFLVLSEMRENGKDWYPNNTVDALGDIFLMASLYLFAEIWCDNVVLLGTAEEGQSPGLQDLGKIRRIYKFAAISAVPMALLFSVASVTHHYDTILLLYTLFGVMVGILLLTPVSFMMYRTVTSLPTSLHDQPLYKQLEFMARVKLYEQYIWNFLIVVTIVSILLFFESGNQNPYLIGLASIAISACWIIMHAQIVLFFSTVRLTGSHTNPVFSDSMLSSLMSSSHDPEAGARRSMLFSTTHQDKIELSSLNQQRTSDIRQVIAVRNEDATTEDYLRHI